MDAKFASNLIVAFVVVAAIMIFSPRATDKNGFNWRDHMVYSWSMAALNDMDMDPRD